jgi:hypothetical protein
MRVGDFFDAMGGYNEGEGDRIRVFVEIIRKATVAMWNTQVAEESRLMAEEFWPLPWDKKKKENVMEEIDDKEYERRKEASVNVITKLFPD